MYIIWFGIAILMGVVYFYIDYSLWVITCRRYFGHERVKPAGIIRFYPIISGAAFFMGISALYFSAIALTGGPHNFRCWLLPTIAFSLIQTITTGRKLNRIAPEE